MERTIKNKRIVLKAHSTNSVIFKGATKIILLVLVAIAIIQAHENIFLALSVIAGSLLLFSLLSSDKLLYVTDDTIIIQKKYLAVFNRNRIMYFKDIEQIETVDNYVTKSEIATTMTIDPRFSSSEEVVIKFKTGAVEILNMQRFKNKIHEFLHITKQQIHAEKDNNTGLPDLKL